MVKHIIPEDHKKARSKYSSAQAETLFSIGGKKEELFTNKWWKLVFWQGKTTLL
jgi:hypothetical protein